MISSINVSFPLELYGNLTEEQQREFQKEIGVSLMKDSPTISPEDVKKVFQDLTETQRVSFIEALINEGKGPQLNLEILKKVYNRMWSCQKDSFGEFVASQYPDSSDLAEKLDKENQELKKQVERLTEQKEGLSYTIKTLREVVERLESSESQEEIYEKRILDLELELSNAHEDVNELKDTKKKLEKANSNFYLAEQSYKERIEHCIRTENDIQESLDKLEKSNQDLQFKIDNCIYYLVYVPMDDVGIQVVGTSSIENLSYHINENPEVLEDDNYKIFKGYPLALKTKYEVEETE